MSISSFRRQSGALGDGQAHHRPGSQVWAVLPRFIEGDHQNQANAAMERVADATIPDAYDLTVETPRGPITIRLDATGDPFDRLGHICFQAAFEAGLRRYLFWLQAIADGQAIPTYQLPSPSKEA